MNECMEVKNQEQVKVKVEFLENLIQNKYEGKAPNPWNLLQALKVKFSA